jgi:hypothetical protein
VSGDVLRGGLRIGVVRRRVGVDLAVDHHVEIAGDTFTRARRLGRALPEILAVDRFARDEYVVFDGFEDVTLRQDRAISDGCWHPVLHDAVEQVAGRRHKLLARRPYSIFRTITRTKRSRAERRRG